jgi:cytochrome c oxidase subunit 2
MISGLNLGDMNFGALKLLSDVGGTFWLPPQASSYAQDTDWLFWFIFWICVFFFLLVAALVVTFAWKYRYREGVIQPDAPKHSTAMELTWTFIPTVIVLIIFVYGFKGYIRMNVPPANSMEMVVRGSMWQYQFEYPNGHTDKELHVPMGVPVEYILTSADVIHGFYIPAFRVKKDIVPGRYNKIWAMADHPGVYDVYCTQYCGEQHSTMRAKCYVESKADYDAWMASAVTADNTFASPVEHGMKLYQKVGCMNCHSVDGKAGTGPTWMNLFGHQVVFSDGNAPLIADENYIRSMIVNPNNKLVSGFQGVMPSFQGVLKDKTHDVDDLIAYIKTLSDKYTPPATTAPTTASATTAAAPMQ